MSRDVDELFGQAGAAPTPAVGTVVGLIVAGMLISVAGLACTVVPGALVVLAAWAVAEKERDRVETGYLGPEHRLTAIRLRDGARAAVAVVVVMAVGQIFLVSSGFYVVGAQTLIQWLGSTPGA